MLKAILNFVVVGGCTLLLFQNCDRMDRDSRNPSSLLPSQNYFSATPPESFCGEEGYRFLMDEYLVTHCGACHDQNEIAMPRFADTTDFRGSYFAATILISDEDWIESTINNTFCGERCNLDSRGEVYQGLLEWLSCK